MTEKRGNEIRVNVSNKQEIEISKELRISVVIPKGMGEVQDFKILVNRYGENPSIIKKMEKTKEDNDSIEYSANVKFDMYGNYYFFFSLKLKNENGIETRAIKIERETGKPFLTYEDRESPYWIVLVIQDNFEVPEWSKDKIFYQVFVDRFYKSNQTITGKQHGRNYRIWGDFPDWRKNQNGMYHNNDFFCGNIKGIEAKLEYLKSLNVGVIYMSPINESLYRYERYASTNHMEIDPDVGTFEDLKSLHDKAKAMGMHLILDVAFNHCSSDNPIFQEALHNPNSKYRNWFYFDENGNYRYWYNEFKDMPVFNQNNQEFQDYIYGENGVVAKFAKYVDGFRLDVAEELQPFFLEGIRNRANQHEKHLIVGECWNQVDSSLLGKSIDSMTNYLYTNAIYKYIVYGEYDYFKWQIEELLASYPDNTIDTMINSLDTHDIVRALTILGGKYMRNGYERIWEIDRDPSPWHSNTAKGRIFSTEDFRKFESDNDFLEKEQYEFAKKLLKIAVIIQYFSPGNPCIFYGTEIGLHGYKDPFNRKCFPWDNMDYELLEFYKKIGELRSHYKGANSEFKVICADQNILAFKRWNDQNAIMVAVNRTNCEMQMPKEIENAKAYRTFGINVDTDKNILGPFGGIVILK